MNPIFRKLRSRKGSSMILAMVFLLFCVFVGSSVLVSATANAYRVNHLEDQQEFLTERSAALLLTDELQLEDSERLQLIVIDSELTYKEVTVSDGGVVVETKTAPYIQSQLTFQVTTNIKEMSPMQQLQLEMAVWSVLQEVDPTGKASVVLKNFPQGDSTDKFLFKPASMTESLAAAIQVTAKPASRGDGSTPTSVTIPAYTASVSCGKGENLYDFRIDFATRSNSQLAVNMDAFCGVGRELTVNSPARAGKPEGSSFTTGYYVLSTKSVQTVIAWDDPLLEKGDAA